MARCRVVMNSAGIERVLSEPKVTEDLEKRGAAVKTMADSIGHATYERHTRAGKKGGRPYVIVAANDPHAIRSNAKRNTLLKAIDAGKD